MNDDEMNSIHLKTHAMFKWVHDKSLLSLHSGWMQHDPPLG